MWFPDQLQQPALQILEPDIFTKIQRLILWLHNSLTPSNTWTRSWILNCFCCYKNCIVTYTCSGFGSRQRSNKLISHNLKAARSMEEIFSFTYSGLVCCFLFLFFFLSCALTSTQHVQQFCFYLKTLLVSEQSFSQPLLRITGCLSGEWMESVPPSENLARHCVLTQWITDRRRHPTSLLGILKGVLGVCVVSACAISWSFVTLALS